MHAVAQSMQRAPNVVDLQRQNHVGAADERGGAQAVVEIVVGGEIHSALLVDHRGTQ